MNKFWISSKILKKNQSSIRKITGSKVNSKIKGKKETMYSINLLSFFKLTFMDFFIRYYSTKLNGVLLNINYLNKNIPLK